MTLVGARQKNVQLTRLQRGTLQIYEESVRILRFLPDDRGRLRGTPIA